jgi:uncharacterized membrane protein
MPIFKGGPDMSSVESNSRVGLFPINRLEALADGVFAIVMTLLVLELSIPIITGSSVNAELLSKLLAMWPKIAVYILSFIILGMMWLHHRFMFHYIKRSDGKLAWLNIILLMFIALIPFVASLVGEYSNTSVAVSAYGIVALLNIIMSLVIWTYITGKKELADVAIDAEIAVRRKLMYLFAGAFFVIGIGLSFVNPIISLCLYGLSALLAIIVSWRDSHGFLSVLFVRTIKRHEKKM